MDDEDNEWLLQQLGNWTLPEMARLFRIFGYQLDLAFVTKKSRRGVRVGLAAPSYRKRQKE